MHVKTQKITFLGALLALTIILQLLGSYIESSTLFFLAASSFCLGIAVYEAGLRLGFAFFIGAVALSVLLCPNKLYCFTYGCFCLYIYLTELIRGKTGLYNHKAALWIVRLLFYNLCFVAPALILFRDLLLTGTAAKLEWSFWVYAAVIGAAQVFLVIFDTFYHKCVPDYWIQLKHRLRIS